MHLDHFVIHVDNDFSKLENLSKEVVPLGYPFDPKNGKGTKGFRTSNMWIGKQYFEIVRLLKEDGGGWHPLWIKKYLEGKRGIYCLYLSVENLDQWNEDLKKKGYNLEVERTSFRIFKLFKITMPWRYILLPALPGTDLQIGLFQYDKSNIPEKFKKMMRPNSEEKGITGIRSAVINLPDFSEAKSLLMKILPVKEETEGLVLPLADGYIRFQPSSPNASLVTFLSDTVDERLKNKIFKIENVEVKTSYAQ